MPSEGQIVVTFREVERILTGTEAAPNLAEVAQRDPEASPVERAAIMAGVGQVLNQLRSAEDAAGALVLNSPHHGPACRMQSLIASGEAGRLLPQALPTGGLEAKFDTQDWFGWAGVAWAKLKHLQPHAMMRPRGGGAEPMPDRCRIGVLGDWGTGLYGAPQIAQTIAGDPGDYFMLLHIGDVYYSGSGAEVDRRFLGLWPRRREALNRALNANHEMYSGGEAYFGRILPAFGQDGSYFAVQNAHWTLVGLDTAYREHDIDDEQVAWLERVLAAAGDRKVVLFSHHQLYSHFDGQGSRLWGHPGFGRILRSGRIFAWYWGHEHRCAIFEEPDPTFRLWARCIGHGAMPQSRAESRILPLAGAGFDRAEWRRSAGRTVEGNDLPSAVILDGGNPFIPGEEDKFAPHGFAVLTLDGPRLTEQVREPNGLVIYEKTFG